MQDLIVTLIQTHLHWESITANLAMFEEKIWKLPQKGDLIVLPEMFTTGFTMNAPLHAETFPGHTLRWMKQMAAQTGAVLVGSFIVKENGNFYNRLAWVQPDGSYDFYDKRHLFRMAGEHEVFKGGNKKIVKNIKGWKICPLVCYDLRFPVWSRNKKNEFDVLLYVANWPEPRRSAWNTLLKARAIENICYVAGVNRTGIDGNSINYSGDSSIIDFKGNLLWDPKDSEIEVTFSLSLKELMDFRKKFPAEEDADSFEIII